MTTPAEHALKAREYLINLEALDEQLANVPLEQRLELAAAGAMPKINADLRWTAELAIAHALTAIALQLTREVELSAELVSEP